MENAEERFWDKVDIGNEDECWLWTAGRQHEYGTFWYDGSMERSHRMSYKFEYHENPGDNCVLHKCDTPLCVNPSHLYLGDRSDNAKDSWNRTRNRSLTSGENHHSSKLTKDDVLEIKKLYKNEDESYKSLSEKFGVSKSTISDIIAGRTWGHVSGG